MRLSDINPQFCLVIGGAGSGKNHFIEHSSFNNFTLVDVDVIKATVGVASAISLIKPSLIEAFQNKEDVVHPTTGGNLKAQQNKIALARKYGYTVLLILIDTPVDVAIAQVRKRYRNGGHDVPLEKIVDSNKKARENFNLLKPFVDTSTIV